MLKFVLLGKPRKRNVIVCEASLIQQFELSVCKVTLKQYRDVFRQPRPKIKAGRKYRYSISFLINPSKYSLASHLTAIIGPRQSKQLSVYRVIHQVMGELLLTLN